MPVEVAGPNLVEARVDQHRYWTAAQSDVERLPGAQKATTNREVDVEIGQLCTELARVRSASRSQPLRLSRIAAEHARDVRGRLGVAHEHEQAPWCTRSRGAAATVYPATLPAARNTTPLIDSLPMWWAVAYHRSGPR